MSEFGRNEPCFCGSGKKYKKCCHGNSNNLDQITKPSDLRELLFDELDTYDYDASDSDSLTLSEIILDLAEDYFDACECDDDYLILVDFAIFAWNCSEIYGEDLNDKILAREFKQCYKTTIFKDTKDVLKNIIEEKEMFYSEVKRIIVKRKISIDDKGIDLELFSCKSDEPSKIYS